MRYMAGILGLALLVLLLSPGASEALFREKKPAATPGEAAKEYAKDAVRDTADAAKNVGESIKQTANAAYETTADAAKTVTGSNKDTTSTGAPYRDSAGRYVEDTYSATKDRAADTAGAVKDAASRGAQTVTGGRQEHGSAGPTGAAYRDRAGRYVADSASTTHGKAAEAAEAVKDTAARATEAVADTARAAVEKASQAATATKDAAVDTAEAAKEKAAQTYDATADTLGSTSDKASNTVGSTRDRVWGKPESEKTYTERAGEKLSDSAQATADAVGSTRDRVWGKPESEKSYTERAGEKLSDSAQATADAARRASQNVRDGAARTYDSTTNTLGTPVRDQDWGYGNDNRGVMDKVGDYYQDAKDTVNNAAYRTGDAVSNTAGATKDAAVKAGEATRDTTYRTMGYEAPSDKGYGSRAYDSARDASSDAYEAGKDKLGNIIEVLGWRRAAQHEHHTRSPYDVMVGNTRYLWNQHSNPDDSYYQNAKDTLGGATDTTSDKASQATNTVSDAATRAKDTTVDAASRATENVKDVAGRAKDTVTDTAYRAKESVKDMTGQTGKTATDYSQRAKEAVGAGAATIGAHKLAKSGRFSRVLRFLHLLTYAVTFGSAVWMTFISGRILSRTISREQFRLVQTKMFPYFLKFMVAGESAITVLHSLTGSASKWSIIGLIFLIVTSAFNAYVLEPKTTQIYHDRVKMEKEEGRGLSTSDNLQDKQKKFNEVHGFSAVLNLLSLAGLTYYAWNMIPALSV